MRVGGIPRLDPVGAHRGEGNAPTVRLVEDRLFVVGPGQLDGRVQAGGDAADHGLGEGVGERLDQRGAARPVTGSHPAQVPVELTAGEEVGERVLLDAGGAQVGQALLVADGRGSVGARQPLLAR
jgi:hypothetical protein